MEDLSYMQENTDALIALGKVGWLKRRKALHKKDMSDEQQEAELMEIERRKEEFI